MANILDALKGYVTPELISQAAGSLGEDASGISKAVGGLLPSVLGGLVQKSTDTSSFGNIFNMLTDQKTSGLLDNLGGLLGGGASDAQSSMIGNFTNMIFGNKMGGILDMISSFAGIKKSSSSSLMNMVAPMVMGYLGRKIKTEGLSMSGLASLLGSQKSSIMGALPAGLGSIMGFADMGKEALASASATVNKAKGGSNWLLPLLLLLAVAAGAVYFMRGCNTPATPDVSGMVEDAKEGMQEAANTVSETVSNATAGLGAFFKKQLACGVELNIPENGTEAQVVAFIEDASKPVDKTTWFNFDRLTFETGKATLDMTKSEEQLKNIVEILKCYPKAKFKIGGYTDNTGNPEANMKLSQERANTVVSSLVGLGIEAGRLEAEGYGDQHPVASNDTEEGRAQNRRIALRVMEK